MSDNDAPERVSRRNDFGNDYAAWELSWLRRHDDSYSHSHSQSGGGYNDVAKSES